MFIRYLISKLTGESFAKLEDSEEDHRSSFVDSLLNGDGSGATASVDVTDYKFPQNFGRLNENKSSAFVSYQPLTQSRLIHVYLN